MYNVVEVFYLNSTLNFGIPPVLEFQLKVFYKADGLLTDLIAQEKGTIARWYSNKTSLQEKRLLTSLQESTSKKYNPFRYLSAFFFLLFYNYAVVSDHLFN